MSIQEFIGLAEKEVKRKSETTEKQIEDKFCTYAISKGCKPLKLITLGLAGFPDRTILCPGAKVFFIEFKRKNKIQSLLQKKVQRYLEVLGFEYYVCDEIGQAEEVLYSFLNEV